MLNEFKFLHVKRQNEQASLKARIRLFCFHDAGGSGDLFKEWEQILTDHIELYLVELPGRQNEIIPNRIIDIVELIAQLKTHIADKLKQPYVLFGHSMGAAICYLLTAELQKECLPLPCYLFLSGFIPPQYWDNFINDNYIQTFAKNAGLNLNTTLYYDLKLLNTLSTKQANILSIPITVFSGRLDEFAKSELVGHWLEQTSADFNAHIIDGGHFYLQENNKAVIAYLNFYLQQISYADKRNNVEEPGSLVQQVPSVAQLVTLWQEFNTLWAQIPYNFPGNINTYDLCWLARIPDQKNPASPLFPDLLDKIIVRQNADGSIGFTKSPHPFCEILHALIYANTLIKWTAIQEAAYQPLINRALNYVGRSYPQLELMHTKIKSYGHLYEFYGFYGCESVILGTELRLLLTEGLKYLTPEQQAFFTTLLIRVTGSDLTIAPCHVEFSNDNPIAFVIGEYFSDEFLSSNTIRFMIRYAYGREGNNKQTLNTAFLAKYYMLTRDPIALNVIKKYLYRWDNGLVPYLHLLEVSFSLMYLLKAQIDVRQYFPSQVDYLIHSMRANGVGVAHGEGWPVDADSTAVYQAIFHHLGIPSPMPTKFLETCWSETTKTYSAADGRHEYCSTGTMLHVLEAYLTAPDVSYDEQKIIWQRTVDYLENRPWREIYHLSPFYNWEKIVSIIGYYAHQFPNIPTRAHYQALEAILSHQQPDGGFCSKYFTNSNPEESGFALIALKIALTTSNFAANHTLIKAAIEKGQRYLWQEVSKNGLQQNYHELWWIVKTLTLSLNNVRSIIVAGLSVPYRDGS